MLKFSKRCHLNKDKKRGKEQAMSLSKGEELEQLGRSWARAALRRLGNAENPCERTDGQGQSAEKLCYRGPAGH